MIEFPFFTMQQLNLDWLIEKVKGMLSFLPDDGTAGQILRRTADGAEWSDEETGGGGAVDSVNGQTGTVVLGADDILMNDNTTVEDSVTDLKSALDDVETSLDFGSSATTVVTSTHTVANRYMTSLGVLKSAGADSYTVSWYPVENGKLYKVSGTASVGGSGQALVCFDNEFNSDVNHACDTVIETAPTTAT
ncbi:MAG: hypothetical protein II630_10225, partial [Bacteroidales bacterium]|nr:hypothetical protein [Bacteroidales bacterium]